MKSYKYLFGPVPSRRFGRSLGVDLMPHKTCSLNCVFCEVGPTTCLTIERKEYVPIVEVERELKEWRAGGGEAEIAAVTGSGEPTLHTGFGGILEFIKKEMKIRTVLLTNSTLMHRPEVRRAAAGADIVKATLSAWDEDSFRKIARPHPDLRFTSLSEGLRLFRQEYSGPIWLEVFIVPGINSDLEQVKAIAQLARTIRPDRIQLNTAVRPTAESRVNPATERFLDEIRGLFEPRAEVIIRFAGKDSGRGIFNQRTILAMLKRRPGTAQDVAAAFSLDIVETKKNLSKMADEQLLKVENHHGADYYIGLMEK